ncbi:MAG TPA: hypothetical protein VND83_00680 [Acidimicrobiales bacterium]|nr:hypothetical protein [Acidimicrobiales bacterium]
MRRALLVLLLAASTVGWLAIPAGAEVNAADGSRVHLSFDFSDNSDPASASNGSFNIIADVLPEHTPGVVRIVAIAPADSGLDNLVCRYQAVQDSQVECGFNFTTSGTWEIKSQYAPTRSSDVSASAVTNIDVSN